MAGLTSMNRGLGTVAAMALLIAVFVAFNMTTAAALKGARLDLTEGSVYTLTNASKRIAQSLEEPVTLKLYFSESIARDQPGLIAVGRRVEEILEEYARLSRSGGGAEIRVQMIDPEPFSEAEDEAVTEGMRGAQLAPGRNFYFGLVGTNSTTGREILPSLAAVSERFMEYELSRIIYLLSQDTLPVLGVMTDLAITGYNNMPGVPPQLQQPWYISTMLAQFYDVRRIPTDAETLPDDLDALLMAHVREPSDSLLYAVDQFVLSGKPTVLMVDPLAEMDFPLEVIQNPQAILTANRSSDLAGLLGPWGIQFDPIVFVGDLLNARPGLDQTGQQVSLLAYQNLAGESLSSESAVTGQLSNVTVGTPGSLKLAPDASITLEPLLVTTEQSQLIAVDEMRVAPDPKRLLQNFAPSGVKRTLAATVGGTLGSAFPSGSPAEGSGSEGHRASSEGDVNLAIIADADLLADQFWIQPQRMGGQIVGYQRIAQNGDFVMNLLESMTGGQLSEVRARGELSRPFTLVEKIEAEAEAVFREREEQLEDEMAETQQRLRELQRQRPEGDSGLLVAEEQQAEMDRFREQLTETRRELRQVRFELDKDVRALESRITFINVAAIPALIALAAVVLGVLRAAARRPKS